MALSFWSIQSFFPIFSAKLPFWRYWPFGPGYEAGFWFSVSKFAFVGLILGVIVLYLRFLFGPKGIFKEDASRYSKPGKRKWFWNRK